MKTCYKCKSENENDDKFCAACGTTLDPKEYSRILAAEQILRVEDQAIEGYIKKIDEDRDPYFALRFFSGLYTFFGWAVIISDFVISGWMFFPSNETQMRILDDGTVVAERVSPLAEYYPQIAIFLFPALLIFGISLLAVSQAILVALDIRNDTRYTKRLFRRFVLLQKNKQ